MKKISFLRFYARLKDQYSSREIAELYARVRTFDPDIQGWVADWIDDKGYPAERIEQMTVAELTGKFHYSPMNAFILMNWLRHAPDEAKYAVMSPHVDRTLSEEEIRNARRALKESGRQPEQEPQPDLSDIEIDAGS